MQYQKREGKGGKSTPQQLKVEKTCARQKGCCFFLFEKGTKTRWRVGKDRATRPFSEQGVVFEFPRSDKMRLGRATPRHSQSADDALA
jgi:hypothetical protein